jgi:hypothetical protein
MRVSAQQKYGENENNVEIMASANQSKISMAKMAAASMAKISKWRRNGAVISVSEMA